jgi:hypothetical protein
MESESPAASWETAANPDAEHAQAFMVTLCRLSRPVTIQPSRSPQLRSFTFFTSRSRQPDGGERLYLHMGYFRTLSDAQQWQQRLRSRYPNALATPVPPALLARPSVDACASQAAAPESAPAQEPSPATDEPLSDTQVMRILETGSLGGEDDTGQRAASRVELLRPDDTGIRRTLKAAVAEGMPVPFAVQLEWSLQPIDASRVPRLEIFNGHTLYRTENRRAGRSCYFLRLGFFTDPLSARELACQVRSTFASAAVVPVTELEFLHAGEARIDTDDPAGPLHQQATDVPHSAPSAAKGPPAPPAIAWVGPAGRSKAASAPQETIEDSLKVLAVRDTWTEGDPLNDTGVRHLKVTIAGRTTRSSQKQKAPIRFPR